MADLGYLFKVTVTVLLSIVLTDILVQIYYF